MRLSVFLEGRFTGYKSLSWTQNLNFPHIIVNNFGIQNSSSRYWFWNVYFGDLKNASHFLKKITFTLNQFKSCIAKELRNHKHKNPSRHVMSKNISFSLDVLNFDFEIVTMQQTISETVLFFWNCSLGAIIWQLTR